jgi:hypothetical protein
VIVYLLVHLPSEMSYVGSTEIDVKHRFITHWRKRFHGTTPLSEAMRMSQKSDWLLAELERYDDLESMLRGEIDWMLLLETVRPKIGFNSQVPTEAMIRSYLDGRRPSREFQIANAKHREDMSEEELELWKQRGRLDSMRRTKSHLSEAGKAGAKTHWDNITVQERTMLSASASANGKSWWNSLTPEQQEAHRQKGREAARKSRIQIKK